MPRWTKRLFLTAIMIERKCGNVLFRILLTPSRLATVIVVAFLVSTLIWSELFSDKNKDIIEFVKYDRTHPFFRYGVTKQNVPVDKSNEGKECPIYQFRSSLETPTNDTISIACKRVPPVPGSCDIAKEIFEHQNTASCTHQERHDFCHIQRIQSKHWNVRCDPKVAQVCTSALSLGMPSHKTGELIWDECQNVNLLEKKLTEIVQGSDTTHILQHYGYAFIWCARQSADYPENASDYYYHPIDDSYAEQLLILPPINKRVKPKPQTPSSFHDLNLNIILVDSVSHQHFFRSLPKTVSVLEQIASTSTVSVLNFELFQAIKSRTFETLQAIFSGSVNVTEPPFGMHDMPSKPLNLAPIFKRLLNRGYRTLWLEDLCYLWEWGISKDLHFLQLESKPEDTWTRMWATLEENGVENIDTTVSMCRVLEGNGVRDHFHGPEAVCFNGKHQHEYLLDYLKLYQEEMNTVKQPFLTVTSTNVGHEGTGKRVQTLDQALANYLTSTPSLDNTISVIFADHGNAYGTYFQKSKEAYIELYQPFMFFIVPHSAGTLLGEDMMKNLKLNTKRLITALDLHYTLLHIVNSNSQGQSQARNQLFPVSEKGLFDPVDPLRTCNSLPRIKPNICICQGFNVPLETSSFASLFGYLAVGVINDEIQRQYRKTLVDKSQMVAAFGHCQPLYLEKVTEIKETSDPDGQRLFQMDIHTQMSQVFFVSIGMTRNKQGEPNAFLETVSRITPYGIFSNCSDATVDLSLCICNVSLQTKVSKPAKRYYPTHNTFQKLKMNVLPFLEIVTTPLKANPCLYVFTLRHKDGTAIFSINECKNIYFMKLIVDSQRSLIYYERKEKALLLPGGVAFHGLVVSEDGESWACSVDTHFHIVDQ